MLGFLDGFLTKTFASFKQPRPETSDRSLYLLGDGTIEVLYRKHRIIQNAIDLYPEDSGTIAPTWRLGDGDASVPAAISRYWDKLEATPAFVDAGILGRTYGDGFIILGVNDGGDLEEPVDENRIRSVDWLRVRSTQHVWQEESNLDFYHFSLDHASDLPDEARSIGRIHKSRILRIPGKKLRGEMLRNNAYRNDSIVQGMFRSFQMWLNSNDRVGSMLDSHSLFKYKISGLKDASLRQNKAFLQDRFEAMLMGLSAVNGLILDAKEEDAEFIQRNYSGLKDLLDKFEQYLIADSDLPRNKLLGSSNVGAFSEQGLSDRYEWDARVSKYQANFWIPEEKKLTRYILLAKDGPTNGKIPDSWGIHHKSILQLTHKERAEIRKIDSETLANHVSIGALDPEEIRESCWGGEEYSSDIVLKTDGTRDGIAINGKTYPKSAYL